MQPAVVETEGVVVVAQTPALLVSHLRKTAGSSLERFVRENIARSAIEVELDGPRISKHGDPAETVRADRDWYRALPAEQRERFRCLTGRTAGYLLPSLDRPAETLVLVREPVDGVLSCHFDFKRRRPKSSQPIAALAETYAQASRWSPGSREAWEYFNGQGRQLLAVYHDVSTLPLPPGSVSWRSALAGSAARARRAVFFVGVHDLYIPFVAEVAKRYGWHPIVFGVKYDANRPAVSELPDALAETARAYNWLDAAFSEFCRETQKRRSGLT